MAREPRFIATTATTIDDDILSYLRRVESRPEGVSALEAAAYAFHSPAPSAQHIKEAREALARLVAAGHARCV